MVLSSLTLKNFRNHTKRTVSFSPSVTLIVGANAAGKTNVLEAIMMLATGKSFRAGVDRETIAWGEEVATIKAKGSADLDLQITLTPGQVQGKRSSLKKLFVHGVPRRFIDFVGNFRAVFFWPEHLELVTDSPSIRRRYLDSVLIQVDREYRRNLLSYERGLRQRNKLLDRIKEGTAARTQLMFWDQLLISAGSFITQKRNDYIAFVNQTTFSQHTFKIEYDKSIISVSRLEQYKDQEIAAKSTLVGPHRDDFRILSHEHTETRSEDFRNLSLYGSRGEQRLAVLWLKLSELSFIEHKTGSRPVLLLDDIFSELDGQHRALVGEVIREQQTILTSAHEVAVPEFIREESSIIRL